MEFQSITTLIYSLQALVLGLFALPRAAKLFAASGSLDRLAVSLTEALDSGPETPGASLTPVAPLPGWLQRVAMLAQSEVREHPFKKDEWARIRSLRQSIEAPNVDPGWQAGELAPTLLTWLGILGTFLGVAAALTTFGTSADASAGAPGAEVMISKVYQMVGPLGAAFTTSIAGLGLAFVVRTTLTLLRQRLDNATTSLLTQLDAKVPLVTWEERLAREVVALRQAVEAGNSARSDADAAQQTALSKVERDLNRVANQTDPGEAVRWLRDEQGQWFNALDSRLESHGRALDDLSSDLADAIEQAVLAAVEGDPENGREGLLSRVNAVAESLSAGQSESASQLADKMFEAIDTRLGERLDGFGESVERVVEVNNGWHSKLDTLGARLDDATARMESANHALTHSQARLVESLHGIESLSQSLDATNAALSRLPDTLDKVRGVHEASEETWEQQRRDWERASDALAGLGTSIDKVETLLESWNEGLDRQVQLTRQVETASTLLTAVQTAAADFSRLSDDLQTVATLITEDMQRIVGSRQASKDDIDARLEALGRLAADTKSVFDGYAQNFSALQKSMPDLERFLASTDALSQGQSEVHSKLKTTATVLSEAATRLESLKDVVEPLATTAQSLGPTAERLGTASSRLGEVLDATDKTLQSTSSTTTAITAAADRLATSTETASSSWKSAADDLDRARQSVIAATTALSKGAGDFGNAVQNTVADVAHRQDQHLATSVQRLQEAVGALNGMASGLAEAIAPLAEALDEAKHERRARR